jgi:hypothetical protein
MTWPKTMTGLYLAITGLTAIWALTVQPWWLFTIVTVLLAVWGSAVALDAGGTAVDVHRRVPVAKVDTVRFVAGCVAVVAFVFAVGGMYAHLMD